MNSVIIGGAGFIGSHLADILKYKNNNDIIIIDDLSTGRLSNVPDFDLYRYDIRYQNFMYENFLLSADYVYFLAARARVQPSIEDPVGYHSVNVNGLLNVLEILRKNKKLKKFVYSSSSSVYGDVGIYPTPEDAPKNPKSPYAVQKLIGEQYVRLYNEIYGVPTVSLRYFSVFGERMTSKNGYELVMTKFQKQLESGQRIKIYGDGEQTRDFTFVGDVARANVLAAYSNVQNEVFNVGSGCPVSINAIANIIDKKDYREYLPPVLEPRTTHADNTKIKKMLKWSPEVKVEDWWKRYVDLYLYS